MKTKNTLLAITAAALALSVTSATAQYVDSVESLNNRAVASSPRAREAFPWLTRVATPRTAVCCGEASDELPLAKKNRAFAASPRIREQFPELAREAAPEREFSIAVVADVPNSVKNNAIANSPRAKEEFPALSRGAMEKGSAKGGASRLMKY